MFIRACLTAAIAAFAALTAPAWAANRELRVADTHPAGYPTVLALEYMGRQLEERSHGALTLKVLHSRLMGEEAETIEHTRIGALDMARVNMAPLNAQVPETIVASLPFLFRSAEHLHKVFDGAVGAEIDKALARHGLVVLAYYDSGARSFYNTRHPVHVPADLKGMRIRVQQSPVFEAMVEALGAIPAALPYGQVAVGLKTGVIDGAENNWPSFQEALHYETARYYALTEHTMAPEVLVMSRKVWNTLSTAEQTMIREAAQASGRYMRNIWTEREAAARSAMVQAGITISEVNKAAFAEAMAPVYDRFASSPALKALVRRIQATK